MAKGERVQFKRGPSSSLPSLIEPGSYLVETDTGNMYVDNSTSDRIQITDTRKQDDLHLNSSIQSNILYIQTDVKSGADYGARYELLLCGGSSDSASSIHLSGLSSSRNIKFNANTFNFTGGRLSQVGTPGTDNDAANKKYVDDAFGELETEIANTAAANLPLKGGTMSGDIDLDGHLLLNIGTPQADGDAATKGYVDNKTTGLLSLSGGTMSGNLNMNNNRVTGLSNPVDNGDAVSKNYMEDYTSRYFDTTHSDTPVSVNNAAIFNDPLTFNAAVTASALLKYDANKFYNSEYTSLDDWEDTYIPPADVIKAGITEKVNTRLPLTGGTLTGGLTAPSITLTSGTIANEPTQDTQIANKSYVDSAVENANYDDKYLKLSGGTLTGQLVLPTGVGLIAPTGSKIQVTDEPAAGTDVVNKAYVDSAVQSGTSGLSFLPLTGGTLTGQLTAASAGIVIPTTPESTDNTLAANVEYVNDTVESAVTVAKSDIADTYLPKTGGTLTGGLEATQFTVGTIEFTASGISGLSSDPESYPSTSDQVATKAYVDYAISNATPEPTNVFDEIIIGQVRMRWDASAQDLIVESYTPTA